jgi:hypothetical protein
LDTSSLLRSVDLKGGGKCCSLRMNNELLFVWVARILLSYGTAGRIMLFPSDNVSDTRTHLW